MVLSPEPDLSAFSRTGGGGLHTQDVRLSITQARAQTPAHPDKCSHITIRTHTCTRRHTHRHTCKPPKACAHPCTHRKPHCPLSCPEGHLSSSYPTHTRLNASSSRPALLLLQTFSIPRPPKAEPPAQTLPLGTNSGRAPGVTNPPCPLCPVGPLESSLPQDAQPVQALAGLHQVCITLSGLNCKSASSPCPARIHLVTLQAPPRPSGPLPWP